MSKLLSIRIMFLVLSGLGQYLIFQEGGTENVTQPVEKEIIHQRDWSEIDRDVVTSLEFARAEAETLATEKIDLRTDDLIERIDTIFLV